MLAVLQFILIVCCATQLPATSAPVAILSMAPLVIAVWLLFQAASYAPAILLVLSVFRGTIYPAATVQLALGPALLALIALQLVV